MIELPHMPRFPITPGPWVPCRSYEDANGPMWPLDADEKAEYEARTFTRIISKPTGYAVAAAHDLFEFKAIDAKAIAKVPELLVVAMWAEAALGYLATTASSPGDRQEFRRRFEKTSELLNEIRD